MKKYIINGIGTLLIVLVLVTITLAILAQTKQPDVKEELFPVNEEEAIENLSNAVKFKTVSTEDRKDINYKEFTRFLTFLKETYPTVYKQLEVETVNEYSVVLKWAGADETAQPIGLTSHYDVVPVAKGTEKDWEQDAFSGKVDEQFIWGRGTLDDKVGVIGTLEAIKYLVEDNYIPKQDIYLLFGHDEEIGGDEGAAKLTEYFKEKDIQLKYILDEGGAIVKGMVPGVDKPVGVIGVAEKGSATAILSVKGSGGHSSQPKSMTNVGRLSKAIANLEEKQFNASISGPTEELFEFTAPEMSFMYKYIFENQWLFKPVIKKILLSKPATAAVVRTTIAPTIFHAGDKDNILPEKAEAIINLRVMPGDTLADLQKQMEKMIDDDQVKIKIEGNEASKVSSTTSESFKSIQKAVRSVDDQVVVAPYIMIGASDSKHYAEIADDAYRFLPIKMEEDSLERMHGTNERIEKKAYLESIQFYIHLLKQ